MRSGNTNFRRVLSFFVLKKSSLSEINVEIGRHEQGEARSKTNNFIFFSVFCVILTMFLKVQTKLYIYEF